MSYPIPRYMLTDRQEVGRGRQETDPRDTDPNLALGFFTFCVSAPPRATLLVLHLSSDSNKHWDQVYFIDFHCRIQASDSIICHQRKAPKII